MRATFVAMGMTLGLAAEAGDLVFRDGFEVPPQMQPSELPSFASLGLYDSASHWNQPIGADPAIASDSAILVQSLEASGSIALQVGQYSAPVFFADPTTPRFDVELACGIEADLGVVRMLDVPIPPWAVPSDDVDGSANPVPPTACGFDSDQDNHMVVLDLTRRCEFDLFQARLVDGKWIASVANNLSIDGAGVYPGGVSSRGSGFPFLGGVIWPDELAAGSMAQTSFTLVMLGIAAAVALFLGVVGIYGVISYTVAQRTREIGVRMAMGAGKREVRRMVLGQAAILAGVGVALGLAASLGLTRLMGSLLYQVSPVDPLTLGTVAALLGGVALLASWIPAWRASRVDPVVALRSEL